MATRSTIDFGIDLGTTNSTIAVIDGTDARVIPNKVGSTVTPSAVWINSRGNLQVGQEAKERTLTGDFDNGDIEFKLRMGLSNEGKKVFVRSNRQMLPEELSAEVLKSLKTDVLTSMGEEIRASVITVPAAFELPQNKATQQAAELAGFAAAPLLLEPVAASLAYGFQSEDDNAYWFVYDFGGGTFDAALMRIREGMIHVVNHNGDNHLGGKLIDWDLVTKILIPDLTKKNKKLSDFSRSNPRWRNAIGRLKFEVEKAKIEVCRTRQPVEIYIESICEDTAGNPVEVIYTLTPNEVKGISSTYIERSLSLCRRTLEEKGLKGSDLKRILMVGGSTLNPWVREGIETNMGAPLEFGIDPVTVVARGAAIFASTQAAPTSQVALPHGTWRIEIENEPVGNELEPDIGGRIIADNNVSVAGYTIELRDKKTKWSSGRIRLGAKGVFMTQLLAEKQRRCEFEIELLDPKGKRIATQPESVFYTIGIPPSKPPCPQTIGIALADGSVAKLIQKGQTLPANAASKHKTTALLRAGNAKDRILIEVIEGENPKAERNHLIGSLIIPGTNASRDLPIGSEVDIKVKMNESLQVFVSVFVPALDEEFDIEFDTKMVRKSPQALRQELDKQKERLTNIKNDADTNNLDVQRILDGIEREGMLAEAEALIEAATEDTDALSQLDRRLLDLAAAIDPAEDSMAWPRLVREAEKARDDLRQIIESYNKTSNSDREAFKRLESNLQRAIDSREESQMRRCIDSIAKLQNKIIISQPSFWIAALEYGENQMGFITNKEQAKKLIAQAHNAINNDNFDALQLLVQQLFSLLPQDKKPESLGGGARVQ